MHAMHTMHTMHCIPSIQCIPCVPCIQCILSLIHSFVRSFIHSFIKPFIHPFIHAFMHSFIHSFIHSCMHAFTHSLTHSLTHLFIHPSIHSFIHPFIRSFTHTLVTSSINSFHLKTTMVSELVGMVHVRLQWTKIFSAEFHASNILPSTWIERVSQKLTFCLFHFIWRSEIPVNLIHLMKVQLSTVIFPFPCPSRVSSGSWWKLLQSASETTRVGLKWRTGIVEHPAENIEGTLWWAVSLPRLRFWDPFRTTNSSRWSKVQIWVHIRHWSITNSGLVSI